jgi:hypothetical protein
MIDDLGGRKADHFLDVSLTNEPTTTLNPGSAALAPILAAVGFAFSKADINPNIRQAYEVSELGEARPASATTPRWVKVSASAEQTKLDAIDFRDEFNMAAQPTGSVSFDIAVASSVLRSGDKDWQTIGRIVYTDSVVSDTCDRRLHFAHPKFRPERSN